MSLHEFDVIQKLGEGAYSVVFKVRRRSDGKIYALKKVRFAPLKAKEKENALTEVRVLASVNHPNIIAYKEAFIDDSTKTLCLVMEFADGGDLLQKINVNKRRGAFFPEKEIWKLALHVTRGLKELHQLRILHRDLKCANIFLSNDGSIRLGDMNVSKVSKRGLAYTQTGTPYYASPEVWKDMPYDEKSDIWSLGCVLYEMASFNPPFQAKDMQGLYRRVIAGQFPALPAQYSQDLNMFIRSLIKVNPGMRPSASDILQMPLLSRNTQNLAELEEDDMTSNLLGTIKVPQHISHLANQLPMPNYEKLNSRSRRSESHSKSILGDRKGPARSAPNPLEESKKPFPMVAQPNRKLPEAGSYGSPNKSRLRQLGEIEERNMSELSVSKQKHEILRDYIQNGQRQEIEQTPIIKRNPITGEQQQPRRYPMTDPIRRKPLAVKERSIQRMYLEQGHRVPRGNYRGPLIVDHSPTNAIAPGKVAKQVSELKSRYNLVQPAIVHKSNIYPSWWG